MDNGKAQRAGSMLSNNSGIPAVNVGGAVVYGEASDGQSNSIVIVDDDIGERV